MSARAAWRLEQLGFTQVFDYVAGRKDWEEAGLPMEGTDVRGPTVADALTHDPPTTQIDETVARARERMGNDTQVVVINEVGVVVGVMRKESWDHPDDNTVGESMRLGPATVRPGAQLGPLVERMAAKETESVLVTDAEGRLIGVLGLGDGQAVLAGEGVESSFETCDSCPGWWRYRLRTG